MDLAGADGGGDCGIIALNTAPPQYREDAARECDNGVVPIVPRGLVDQSKIKAGVRKAERALAPDVIRIMYSVAEDTQGDMSLFFRILMTDQAAVPNRLRETTQRIIAKVLREVKAQELGLQTYFNFRSKSEQEMLRESFWERS